MNYGKLQCKNMFVYENENLFVSLEMQKNDSINFFSIVLYFLGIVFFICFICVKVVVYD